MKKQNFITVILLSMVQVISGCTENQDEDVPEIKIQIVETKINSVDWYIEHKKERDEIIGNHEKGAPRTQNYINARKAQSISAHSRKK